MCSTFKMCNVICWLLVRNDNGPCPSTFKTAFHSRMEIMQPMK